MFGFGKEVIGERRERVTAEYLILTIQGRTKSSHRQIVRTALGPLRHATRSTSQSDRIGIPTAAAYSPQRETRQDAGSEPKTRDSGGLPDTQEITGE